MSQGCCSTGFLNPPNTYIASVLTTRLSRMTYQLQKSLPLSLHNSDPLSSLSLCIRISLLSFLCVLSPSQRMSMFVCLRFHTPPTLSILNRTSGVVNTVGCCVHGACAGAWKGACVCRPYTRWHRRDGPWALRCMFLALWLPGMCTFVWNVRIWSVAHLCAWCQWRHHCVVQGAPNPPEFCTPPFE